MLSACDDLNITGTGVDMSKELVIFGNTYMHKTKGTQLVQIDSKDLVNIVETTDANVVTAIGVMEHVINFHPVYKAIMNNKNIKYFYMMVPLFGLSNILEIIAPDIYNRHLGGVHTHVFSQKSIEYLNNQYNMELIAKWQFGTDMMDLLRICIGKTENQLTKLVQDNLYKCIDDMQLVLDKNAFCSEGHFLMKCH